MRIVLYCLLVLNGGMAGMFRASQPYRVISHPWAKGEVKVWAAPDLRAESRQAAACWQDDGLPPLVFQDQPEGADIQVRLGSLPQGGTEEGLTLVQFDQKTGTACSAEIVIGQDLAESDRTVLLRHEFGHALGIYGHSPVRSDLMSAEIDGPTLPTPADHATMRQIYGGGQKT